MEQFGSGNVAPAFPLLVRDQFGDWRNIRLGINSGDLSLLKLYHLPEAYSFSSNKYFLFV